jgi:pantoate--beta-alanine ligase
VEIVRTLDALREYRKAHSRMRGTPLGFVPTMGALHEGHLSLIREAISTGHSPWASIFVNPLQFGPNEDLAKYPRPFERDAELFAESGCEVLFAPDVDTLTPSDMSTQVIEGAVSLPLCGKFRPGHFAGVATIVLKLFNLVQPDSAFFGEKDAQQCAVIERLVRDLNLPVTIVRVPTLREPDGLAMSSRNRYLSEEERARATEIYKSFQLVQAAIAEGTKDPAELEVIGQEHLEKNDFKVQYYELREKFTLRKTRTLTDESTVFVAAYLGTTRLIDNFTLAIRNRAPRPQPRR